MQTIVGTDRLSLAFLESLFDGSNHGFGMVDADLRVLRANDVLCGMFGAADDPVGRSVADVAPTLARDLEPILSDAVAAGRPALHVELAGEVSTAPGEARFWDVSVYPVTVDGRLAGAGLVVVDVSERVCARVRLEEHAGQVYEHVVQSLAVAKMALELGGMEDAALDAIDEALAAAKRIVSSVVFGGLDTETS